MSIIKAELNVKRNSTDYDILNLTTASDLVEYNSTTEGKSSIVNAKLALDSLLRGDYISLANGSSAISYVTITQEVNTCQFIKIKNCSSVPTNYGYSTSDNDFLFISIKTPDNIRLIGVDIITKSMFNYVVVGGDGSWTRINDGGNANSLDGIGRMGFMQNYPNGTGLNLSSTTYNQPYIANINEAQAISIGLPNAWWHLMYLPHANNSSGYGYQVAYPLNNVTLKPKCRMALGTVWQDWQNFNDGGNADAVDGYHANPAIGTPALKQIYAGTTDMVAGTTNLAQGTVYFVYE